MTKEISEAEALTQLIDQGYRVEVSNPYGKTFAQKYKVFQGQVPDQYRKIVIVNEQGEVRGLQG